MRMAYAQNGQLMIDRGLGWTPAAAAPGPIQQAYDPGLGATPAAETGSGPMLVVGALLGLWAISSLIGNH